MSIIAHGSSFVALRLNIQANTKFFNFSRLFQSCTKFDKPAICEVKHGIQKLKNTLPEEHDLKRLKVAFIGRPNVGKSTIINELIGNMVCPVSWRAHTTRIKARAVQIVENTQIIYLDTAGAVSQDEQKKFKFDTDFLKSSHDAMSEADIIGVVLDVSNQYEVKIWHPTIIRLLLMYPNKTSFLILNKVDALKKKRVLIDIVDELTNDKERKVSLPSHSLTELQLYELAKKIKVWPFFKKIFMISALMNDGVDDVKQFLLNEAYPGKWLFFNYKNDPNESKRKAAEFLRSVILDTLDGPLPYKLEIEVLETQRTEEGVFIEFKLVFQKFRDLKYILADEERRFTSVKQKTRIALESYFQSPCVVNIILDIKQKDNKYKTSAFKTLKSV